jgi:hypothetical protein
MEFNSKIKHKKATDLYNSQGQGAFGRCWAASMATILNYLNGTDITAANVCDAMNIGYNTGASIDVAMNAMALYSSSPYIYLLYDQTSFFEVEVNLDIKKPMYLSTVDTNDSSKGHAVALTGYVSDLWNSIVLWNPGLNNGLGGAQIVDYVISGTTFAYNNTVYRWRYTLSYTN